MLTKKQRELLVFIDQHMTDHDGVAPSFVEMKDALGLKSKSGIHRLLGSLVERGYVERIGYRARALRIIKDADGVARDVAPLPTAKGPTTTTRAPAGLPESMPPSEIAYRLGLRMRQRGNDDDDAFEAIIKHLSDGVEGRAYSAVSS